MDSILSSIKQLLGIQVADKSFDQELVIHINSVLAVLNQLGVGPTDGFVIIDETQKWSDFISIRKDLELIKDYVYLKVRLLFDPPQNSFLVDSIKEQIQELEWRINTQISFQESSDGQIVINNFLTGVEDDENEGK